MQSEKQLHKRRWEDYPQLDQLLSRNQPSMHWHGPTSISHNIFNQVEDLLSVYALVADQHQEIERLSHKAENVSLRRDLRTLDEHLQWMADYFKGASNTVRSIGY